MFGLYPWVCGLSLTDHDIERVHELCDYSWSILACWNGSNVFQREGRVQWEQKQSIVRKIGWKYNGKATLRSKDEEERRRVEKKNKRREIKIAKNPKKLFSGWTWKVANPSKTSQFQKIMIHPTGDIIWISVIMISFINIIKCHRKHNTRTFKSFSNPTRNSQSNLIWHLVI